MQLLKPLAMPIIVVCIVFSTIVSGEEPRGDIPSEWTAVYLRNDTQLPIKIGKFDKYGENKTIFTSGASYEGREEDYWHHDVREVAPGSMRKVLTIDDNQDIVDYRDTKFQLPVSINGASNKIGYVHMKVRAGIANFEFACTRPDPWTTSPQFQTMTFGDKTFKLAAAKESDGDIYFTVSDPTGNGGFVPDDSPSKDELTVINYNTYLLIGPSTKIDLIAVKPDFCERAKQMVSSIPKVDVLILNELCSKAYCEIDASNLPDRILQQGHYKYKSRPHKGGPDVAGASAPLACGGLIVLSKFPVENVYEGTFSFTETGMPKGFLIVKVNKQGQDYYVVGTHTNSERSNQSKRAQQFSEIAAAVRQHVPANARIVLGGDLNVYGDEIAATKRTLKMEESGFNPIVPTSYDYRGNYYTDTADDHQKFDWILWGGTRPASMNWRYVPIRSVTLQPSCDLSDHNAVYAHLKYATSQAPPFLNKTVVIKNDHSKKLLTLKAGYWNGSEAYLDDAGAEGIQKWVVRDSGNGTYKFVASGSSGMLLSTKHFSHKPQNDQDPIILHGDLGDASQQWKIEHWGSGVWKILNAHSGKAICTMHNSQDAKSAQKGEKIIQFNYYGNATQHWYLESQ